MIKVAISQDLCVGCGLCEENMPELFIIKEQKAHVLEITGGTINREELDNMIDDCPACAISVRQEQ